MKTVEMTDKILITNIQRFSLHDGPGIRTTVFLKGCSLRCPWCSNPENLTTQQQNYVKDGMEGIYGEYLTSDELLMEVLKDKVFYEGKITQPYWNIIEADQIEMLPGGVTFSGGECLLQINQLEPVLKKLNEQHIHTAVETCLFVPATNLTIALNYINFFYVDMKIIDDRLCKEVECGNLSLYLSNLERLLNWKSKRDIVPVVIRIPVIGTYTDQSQNRKTVKKLIGQYKNKILKIELIKEHNLGKPKYKSLGMEGKYVGVTDELMEIYKTELSDMGIPVEVCKI